MKKLVSSLLVIVAINLLSSCSGGEEKAVVSQRDSLLSRIQSLEATILKNKNANLLDQKLANETMNAYQQFSITYKKDSLSAWYLFRAADLASSALGMHEQALSYYDEIIGNYKTFPKYPEALFLAGFIAQDKIHDGARAKKYYDQLIAEFPKHEFVDDAQAMLSFFGKSDEEIVREFEKKNEEKMKK